jgi:selT/selW/selH-like putative selenoprotein
VGLQRAAQEKFAIKPKTRWGSTGDFAVFVNGKEVFDHKRDGAIPSTEDLLRRIAVAAN